VKRSLIYTVIGAGIAAVLALGLLSTPLNLNHPPIVTVNPSKSLLAGSNVILGADSIIDEDGDPLTYNWTQLSGEQVLLFNSNTSNPTFSIAPSITNRTLTFQLEVSDGKVTRPAVVNVVVLGNRPPMAVIGDDQTVNKGDKVVLDGSGSSDPENAKLIYKWAQSAGPQAILSDNSTATPTFIAPSSPEDRTLTFQLIVNDGFADSKPDTVKITVKANKPPVANAGPDQVYKKDAEVILSGLGSSDPEKDKLTYQWKQIGGPDITLSDSTAVKPTFVAPGFPDDKILTFQLIVNDGTVDSKPDTVKITVKANKPPVANAGLDKNVGSGKVSLDGTASSDPDDDKLTYQWKQIGGPEVKLSDPKVAKPTFNVTATDFEVVLTFQLIVNDGTEDSKPDTVKITVKTDKQPIANAGLDRDVGGESQVTLDGSKSSDPEGKKLTYQWKQTSGPSVELSDPKVAKPTFKAPATTTTDKALEFQLIVNDGTSDSKPDTVKITVKANRAPVANAGPDKTVNEGNDVILDGSKSTDPDGNDLSYEWKQISGTGVTIKYSKEVQAVFRAPDISKSTVLTFQLTVNDGKLSKTDLVQITVKPR
jgi:large repetitive protein